MDPAVALARNVVSIKYEDIPAEAIDLTKKDILDTLGVSIAGSTGPGSREVVELVREWGGKEESSVIAYGGKLPAPLAALANGTMARTGDYEDTHEGATLHAGSVVVPAAFAIAERNGGADGREFITAVTLGLDLLCRMGLASKEPPSTKGWSYTGMYGYFAAAATAGKLLKLDEDKMGSALGIAYLQSSGNLQGLLEGAISKVLLTGLAAKGGIVAALMAQKGITGAKNSLEGQAGLYRNLRHKYDPAELTSELGTRFEGVNLGFKPYPSCRYTHASIYAMLEMRREHRIKPEDIEEITVLVGGAARRNVCEPLDRKRRPPNIIDAQFSVPYTVAVAATNGNVTLADFTLEAIRDRKVLVMAQKVKPQLDSSLSARGIEPVVMKVKVKGGEVYTKRVDFPKGHIKNPMSMEELIDKFRDCAKYAVKPLPKENVERAIKMTGDLERVKDVCQIIRLLG